MAITYHAGRRIQGTNIDSTTVYRGETPVTDGSDTVITFLQDGKFTPTSSFDVEYLVVGGGGGSTTGGGGAGGYLASNSKNHGVTAQDYNISVGAGGTCTSLSVGNGKGGDSSFDTITATGGGSGGGSDQNQTGVNGGSGGGGHSGWNPPATSGGSGNTPSTTPSQGNDGSGGSGSSWSYAYGGAGGGSASAGSGAQPRVGGSGTQNDITGTNTYYSAGGGGASWFTAGGAGGTGGGGNAGDYDVGVGQDGQTYGSGGGATFAESGKASGKQGIVVIRFATSGNTYETSLGGRPTNVQAGSRFEETDTRKMYYYGDYPTVSDDLTTDKGWVSNTGSWTYNATGDYIDFATITRSTTAQRIYIDVQDADYLGSGNNLSDSSWVARFKIRTGTQSSSTGNVLFYLGFSNNLDDSGTTQQSATMQMNFNGQANGNNMQLAVSRANFETTGSPARVNSDVYANSTLPYSTDRYMEMTRNGDVFTLKAYSDEYITQATSTSIASVTVTGISGLQYIKAFNDSEQAQSYTSGGARLYDMKIYNGVTSAGDAWKEIGT